MNQDGAAWKALVAHHATIGKAHLRHPFAADPGRGEWLAIEAGGLDLDYSKNRATEETMRRQALIRRYQRTRGAAAH